MLCPFRTRVQHCPVVLQMCLILSSLRFSLPSSCLWRIPCFRLRRLFALVFPSTILREMPHHPAVVAYRFTSNLIPTTSQQSSSSGSLPLTRSTSWNTCVSFLVGPVGRVRHHLRLEVIVVLANVTQSHQHLLLRVLWADPQQSRHHPQVWDLKSSDIMAFHFSFHSMIASLT